MADLCQLCQDCVKQYKIKHPGKSQFEIPCDPIPACGRFDPNKLVSGIPDPEERGKFLLMMDPVAWAKGFLVDPSDPTKPLVLREPYQTNILQCRSRKKILRMARRLGKTVILVTYALWRATIQPGCRIVFLTPFKKQISEIFEMMRIQFDNSDIIGASVVTFRFTPHLEVKFNNGARITGFVSSSGNSKKSSSVRSADAHIIILDEADYIPQADVDAVGALLMSHPDVELFVSSTPSGRRDKFYQWCYNNSWHEFHYDCTFNPNWGAALKKEMVEFYGGETSSGYVHECLADFGDVESGVFPKKFVDECLFEYNISTISPYRDRIYVFGVDWNKKETGTQIVIVGLELVNGRIGAYWLERHESISDVNFTQLAGCNRIRELNRIYNPAFIYVDVGYGSTNLELLHKWGQEDESTGLGKKVKGIDFGSKIDIIDPFTKQKVPKDMKPFIVENTRRFLEAGVLRFPYSEDETRTGVVYQMREYIIDHYTINGRPVYSEDNDHALMAYALALLAFNVEFGDLCKIKFAGQVGFLGYSRNKVCPNDTKSYIERERHRHDDIILHRDPSREAKEFKQNFTAGSRFESALSKGQSKSLPNFEPAETRKTRDGGFLRPRVTRDLCSNRRSF